ncbi:hypothetical protein ACFX13_036458 [Malus domestica]
MESSSTSSRFRFRDLPEMENSTQSDTASDLSSVSSDGEDDESDLQSMTGKGIKHLCSELLELKAASGEEFHKHIFSNYSAFVRIFEEVGLVENELKQLKNHVVTQKRLVSELADGIYLKVLSKETIDLVFEEPEFSEFSEPVTITNLGDHANDVLATLDTLLSENRIDEALTIFELEDENFQRLQFEEGRPLDELRLFSTEISERKALVTMQLTMVAENPRIAAPELQKALVGLCRLGDSHLATQLLIKYYRSRIASGTLNLQASKSFLNRVYIRELSKFVFSMISQAARSFVMLYGETSSYASELIQWARRETKLFGACFDRYVKSISEISGGLSTAVEAVQFAMSFCSLLESQRLVLRPYLINYIRPCIEEVLRKHLDHFKKVVDIFTATDAWVLGRYLVSGIMNEGCSSMVVGQQPEYCLLTNSGRKFVTLLQSITLDVNPLVSLQIEGSIVSGLMILFKKYVDILEIAINCKATVTEKSNPRIYLAESVQQQVSILANLSSLEQLFSNMVRGIFKGVSDINSELMKTLPDGYQAKELDSCISLIQEASSRLRDLYCEQFICKIMSLRNSDNLTPENCIDDQGESCVFQGVMPSLAFQVLFLELRKLEKLSEDNVFEIDWLMELLRELIEAVFAWIPNNKEIWDTDSENMMEEHPFNSKQFVLDVQFLVEISAYGGYYSNNPLFLINLMKSALLSAGLDPKRDVSEDVWAIDSAAEAIQKLLEIENSQSRVDQEPLSELESGEEEPCKFATESFQDDRSSSEEDAVVTDDSEGVSNVESEPLNAEEPCMEKFKISTDSVQDDACSSNESLVATYGLEGDLNAESEPLDTEPSADQSKNPAKSFADNVISSLEDYAESEEDEVATYDPGCMEKSENASESFREDVTSSLDDSVQPEVAITAETESFAETRTVESQRVTESFEDDALSPSEDDVVAMDKAEAASSAETTPLIKEPCPQTKVFEKASDNAVDTLQIIEETDEPSA